MDIQFRVLTAAIRNTFPTPSKSY